MDGIMVDRHSHHSHTPFSEHITSSHLPIPLSSGHRSTYDEARGQHISTTSPAFRSDLSKSRPVDDSLWDGYQPRQRTVGREDQSIHSGSYQSNSSRPSLPSLRTVLGESTRSPPTTPLHQGASLQPLPREPVYDQSTYKPPSLYPNKRTRTDSGWDGQDADRKNTEVSSGTLPYLNSRQDDRTMPAQLELPTLRGESPKSYRYTHSTQSHQPSPEHRGRSAHVHSSPRLTLNPAYGSQHGLDHPFQSLQQHRLTRDVHMDGAPFSAYDSASITNSRSPSISVAEEGIRRASAFGHLGSQQSYRPDTNRQSSLMPSAHNINYRDEYTNTNRMDGSHSYNAAAYPYAQAFFVPSHYEYQNGKSRKRSNLPKQSTEIMKRWFDDNLQNPYPSEEQKRHFAAVAGINLTQVSNWFINHRRRCPELREKRDKGRAGSRDESV